ncbi:MAG: class I SAM-dependent methyltransferase [Actinomycetota bacterium]
MDARAWDDRYAAAPLVWSAGPNRFVEEAVTGMTPGRALDVACGEGRNALWLAALGWRATAVDFSAVAIDKGRALAAERGLAVDWVVADVTTWAPEPPGFDLVLVCYLQLPAEERATAYRRAADAVAPGGTLLVVAHDVDNIAHGHGGPQDPAVCTTPEAVVAVIGDLTVVAAGRVHRPVPTEAGTVEAIDTLVRATRA